MDNYLLLKFIHIVSAVILAGTGTGIAFFMFMAARSQKPEAIAVVARLVVLADWIFTAPAVVVQFVSGLLLMKQLGYSFAAPWFHLVISIFLLIGLCWLPVVVIQYRLIEHAERSVQQGNLSAEFQVLLKWWTALGVPAFLGVLVMFWLMIFKPFSVV